VNYRTLGRTGLRISELGYGAWGIGGIQWQGGSDDQSLLALRRAFELGVNFIDTALAYGEGHSEQLVGRAVKEWREPLLIATKIPPKNRMWPAPDGATLDEVFPRKYVLDSTDASLRHLGVERIDLQQFHVWNPRWTRQAEWRRMIEDLKQSGKVRHFGASLTQHDPDSGLELVETGLIDAVQVIYNIFDPSPAARLFPSCERLDVGVLARVPLDEGGLTGTIEEDTVFEEGEFRAHYFRGDRKRQVVERVRLLQKDLNGVPGDLPEIALRFCITPAAVTSVIPGMRRVQNVERSARACEAGPLTSEVQDILRRHEWRRNFYD